MEPSATVVYTDHRGVERRLVFRMESGSNIPRFEQLRAQFVVMVSVGRLEPGDRIPTVRDLAYQLRMAPGTVARTYRELEADGIVEGRGRAGTFVVDEPPHSEVVEERQLRTAAAAARFTFELRQLGVTRDAALSAVETAWDEPGPERE